MAVGILEAAAVHEAEILRRGRVGLAARLDGLVDLSVDFLAAARRHAEQDLRMGALVGDRLRREGRPFLLRQHLGRASCSETGRSYGYISMCPVSLNKKQT